MEYFSRQNGELFAENVPLSRIAEQFGTPTFIYSRQAISDAYHRFDAAFESHPHQVCYAVKANSNLGVLSLLASLGASFDIVSGGELERVLRAGGDPSKVVFSGVGKTAAEIKQALSVGIACFNVESRQEMNDIIAAADQLGRVAPISIRVNPDVDAKTHPYISTGLKENKFGVSIEVAREMYRAASASTHLDVVGIDCHIGSQILELGPFVDALERILALVSDLEAEGIHLQHIDLGGGIGVTYKDEQPLAIETYAGAILQHMGKHKHTLMFEPGRFIVANAGVLLSRVINLKPTDEKHFCIIDAAMNDLIRPALYQAWQEVQVVTEKPGISTENYDVVGPVCETGDFLARDRQLAVEHDDLIAVFSAGAYGFVMSSNYNSRNRAAEVIVDDTTATCVRQRETIDDQLRLEHTFKA